MLCGITFINLCRLCYNYAKYAALRKIPRVISSSFIALWLRYAAQRRLRRAVAVPTSHIITKNRPQGSAGSWVFARGEEFHSKISCIMVEAGYCYAGLLLSTCAAFVIIMPNTPHYARYRGLFLPLLLLCGCGMRHSVGFAALLPSQLRTS